MLANTISATDPTAGLNVLGSPAQTRMMMMEMTKAEAIPSKPMMKAIVPLLFATFRSPLSHALSDSAASKTARTPKGQLQVPRSVKMATVKCDGGFSPRKFGGCTEWIVVGRSP